MEIFQTGLDIHATRGFIYHSLHSLHLFIFISYSTVNWGKAIHLFISHQISQKPPCKSLAGKALAENAQGSNAEMKQNRRN